MQLMIRNNIRRSCDGSRIIGYFPTWRNSASLFQTDSITVTQLLEFLAFV